ncbi:DUF2512 family protein [Lederbergia lenta]|nr:DUF2512 family protein [Lederbergia lenta]MCM3111249.1 YndM family protein [Lederbergia lenta]MEC2325363.1 DUF2512 family protein [Lederbergia lenta]
MTSLLLKIFTCPIAVIVAMYLFTGVDYVSLWQPIVVGLVLAVVGVAMEYFILKRGTLWGSVIADFAASVLIVYLLSNLLWNSSVTFLGAVLIGLLLGVVEYFIHRYLITTGKTQKSPV